MKLLKKIWKFWQEVVSEEKVNVLKYKVNNLWDEIEVWWVKCFLSEEERQKFEDYKSTCYTPELYDSHVQELEQLKSKFYGYE